MDGDPSNGGSKFPYYDFKGRYIDKATGEYLDYWGRSYHYRQPKNSDGSSEPSAMNKDSFDLWSEGEVSVKGGDVEGLDDINNWEPKHTQRYPFYLPWLVLLLLVVFNCFWFYHRFKGW